MTVQYESTTIENTRQKADVSVVKKDSDTENPLDGGKYTLYAGNDIKNYAGQVIVTKGTALETVTTGEDGKASYSVDLPISNGYYVSKTQAPYAYIRNSKDVYSFNFNVLPETQAKASFSHTFVNDRTTAKIHIYKVDKGNPVNPDGYDTAFLWERVLCKDSLMEILQKYMHLQQEYDKNGNLVKETMIFPRYHQLDVVTKLLEDVKKNGSGKSYLIQHSAGSGKSNSIAWLAHRLTGLHDYEDNKIFQSVIIVTDRRVLDSQLQSTVYQFDHVEGVVKKVDKNSGQLRDAAKKLKRALADTEEILKEYAEMQDEGERNRKDDEDKLLDELAAQGMNKNLSFFAFTATPKGKTLQMFGQKDAEGIYRPFHIYSMRQAIEEHFILDVLQNYMLW